jgi:hypothetical protein
MDLATILKKYGADYQHKYKDKILPGHVKAIRDIMNCRTEALGGQLYYCHQCQEYHYSYHSCGNRHCPKCGNEQAEKWLKKQIYRMLPVPYFLVTFTLHNNLRQMSRSQQKLFYKLLFRTASQALLKLTADHKYLGGIAAMIALLHTWGRDMSYHPHLHFIVSAGGISQDGKKWLHANENFLVPVKALSLIFRAKFREALKKEKPLLFQSIPRQTWHDPWVVHCIPVGSGEAALKYLATYIFRTAISNKRILSCKNGKVTFSYTPSRAKCAKTMTLAAEEFIRRFLQHVLPKGLVKLRYYGLLANRNKKQLSKAKEILRVIDKVSNDKIEPSTNLTCPKCGSVLIFIREIPRVRLPP